MSPSDLSPQKSHGVPLVETTNAEETREHDRASLQSPECRQENGPEGNKVTTQSKTQNSTQNRVCVTCRRRKVKCDKRMPCQNCVKARAECFFPSKRVTAEGQSSADSELLHELRRLEPLFQSLVSKINPDNDAQPSPKKSLALLESASRPQPIVGAPPSLPTANQPRTEIPANGPIILDLPSLHGSPMTTNSVSGSEVVPWSPYGTTVGKLVKDSGRNRYVSGLFWDALHTEDDDGLSESMSDVSDHAELPSPANQPLGDYIYLEQGTPSRNFLHTLHPPLQQRLRAWQLFKENIHPLVSILHIPTIEPVIMDGLQTLDEKLLSARIEPLVFVVYYGAVTSLTPEATLEEFELEQATLLRLYRSGLQGALSHARLLETDDMPVLQAFVLFLTILRRHDPSLSWNLTGLAVRLAQSRGIHRDGTLLKISKFDAEMRRRLWWQICLLDTASSEDHSCTPTILEVSSFDAALPRNYNDSDLYPDMTEYPPERQGLTDICFTYARCRLTDIWRTIVDNRRPARVDGKSFALMTMAEKVCWVDQQQQLLEKDFLHSTSKTEPLHWVTETLIKLLICNLQLFVYNPLGQNSMLTPEETSIAFLKAIQALEHSYSLRTDPRGQKWAWLLSCYHEWFAFALVLSELCARPLGELVDRAWRTVEQSVVLRWNSVGDHRRAHQWRSITKTLDKARAERKKARKNKRSNSTSNAAANAIKRTKYHGNDSTALATSCERIQTPALLSKGNQTVSQLPDSSSTTNMMSHNSGQDLLPFEDDMTQNSQTMETILGMDLEHSFFDMRPFDNFLPTTRYANFNHQVGD